jgi:hypothetical protein
MWQPEMEVKGGPSGRGMPLGHRVSASSAATDLEGVHSLCDRIMAKLADTAPDSARWQCSARFNVLESHSQQHVAGASEEALVARDIAGQLREVEVALLAELRNLPVPEPEVAPPDLQTAILLAKMYVYPGVGGL